jgi:hypothetical protein
MGSEPPPIGGIPRPRRHGPRRRPWSWYLWRARVIGGGAIRHRGGTSGRDGGTPQPSRMRKRGFSNLR